jgi:hypothetical protein
LALALSAVLLFASMAAAVAAEPDKAAAKPSAAPMAMPGKAEMERLKFYVGDWEYTENYPKSKMSPDGMTNTGIYTSKAGPGGNSLINTFHSRGPAGESEGLIVMTWDAKESAYKEYVFGTDSPGAIVGTGTFAGDTLVFRSELGFGGRTMKLRNTTRLTAEGNIESAQYASVNDGPERLLVQVVAARKH